MPRALPILALLPLACLAHAQGADLVRIRLAGGFSQSFDASSGRSVNLQGPEIAVAIRAATFKGNEVFVEPSYFGGGRLRHGHDVDSDVFRLTGFVRHRFGRLGARIGVGYAESGHARGGEFGRSEGAIVDAGIDVPLASRVFADIHAIYSGDNRRGGYFAGVGVRF